MLCVKLTEVLSLFQAAVNFWLHCSLCTCIRHHATDYAQVARQYASFRSHINAVVLATTHQAAILWVL